MAIVFGDQLALPSPLQELSDERLGRTRLLLKRDDLIHPDVHGSKWRKLKYLLAEARVTGAETLLTFGGAYSNHVRAVASAGRRLGFSTIGVIRGEERPFNPGLGMAVEDGMRLHYLDRATYRRKTDPDVIKSLRREFGDFFLIPEGGTTVHALPGCAELLAEIDSDFDLITCAVGTGGTLAGIAAGLTDGRRALGVSALRGAFSLDDEVEEIHRQALGRSVGNWSIDHRFHFGGFARRTVELDDFVTDFARRHGVVLDHVYVAKMLFGLYQMIVEREVTPGTVVALISGSAEPVS